MNLTIPCSNTDRLMHGVGNPNDAFWLAQTHFLTHQFAQAERLLTATRSEPTSTSTGQAPQRKLTDTSLACRYLAAQCQVRLGKWEEALEMVGRGGGTWGEITEMQTPGDGGVKVSSFHNPHLASDLTFVRASGSLQLRLRIYAA